MDIEQEYKIEDEVVNGSARAASEYLMEWVLARRTGSDAEHSDRAGLDLRAACVVHQVVEEAERARLRLELTPAHVKGTRSAGAVRRTSGRRGRRKRT